MNKSMVDASFSKEQQSKPAPTNLDPERYYVEFAHACARGMPNKDCSKYFKRYDTKELPRVRKIIGILKGISPDMVLDVGSGRGRLLWPMMYQLPHTVFTSYEMNEWRCEVMNAVRNGGCDRLCVVNEDICSQQFEYNGLVHSWYDAIVASEVLEHIPNAYQALENMVWEARGHIIITVPNKPDNNPDHIHFFQPSDFEEMFDKAEKITKREVKRITFDYTLKELVVHVGLKWKDTRE